MTTVQPDLARAKSFCEDYGLRFPILLAPMAGAFPPSLSVAVANAGGLGACGSLLMQPDSIEAWAADFRAGSNGGFQLNLWIPDPAPTRDELAEQAVRTFLGDWGQRFRLMPPTSPRPTSTRNAKQCLGPARLSYRPSWDCTRPPWSIR